MKTVLVFILLCVSVCTNAQEFPNFGIVTNEELALKQCAFDKNANAVVLLHEAFADYDDRHQLITHHHVRIKILKEAGFTEANVTIPFYRKDEFEFIDRVEGVTINNPKGVDITVTKLEKKAIFKKNIDELRGEVIFTFPEIKAGSMIEYKYTSVMRHYGGLQDWSFQEHLPVVTSKFHLVIIPNTEFAYRVNKTMDIAVGITPDKANGAVQFEMNNIPGLENEPYMDARKDYLQKVIFQLSGIDQGSDSKKKYMTSWDEVTRELSMSAEFGNQLGKSIPGTSEFLKLVKLMPLPEDKMKSVYEFVRRNMGWNHVYSKYSMEGVKDAWQKKSGSSGDINLILVNLLKEAGLEAFPMLVSERFHGKVDPAYPFIDQFNSVFACVNINGRKYYLDATDLTTPAHITPNNILNTNAFIVNRKSGGLVTITNDTTQYRDDIIAHLKVQPTAELAGDLVVWSGDYSRMEKLEAYKADKAKFLRNNFIVNGTSIAGKELEVLNAENDSSALQLKLKLSGGLNNSGGYYFLPLNLFTGFDSNPFLSEDRFSNINFGYP